MRAANAGGAFERIEFAGESRSLYGTGHVLFIAEKEINARLIAQGGPMSKNSNRRKFVRRPLSYPAKIVATDGSWGRNCRVIDVSDGGAKLALEKPAQLPQEFFLALSVRGKAARKCHVMWTDENEIGVQFVVPAEAV
jgi:hypothetical protein